jgi:AsmA-like C-terminal region/Protein of unknown function
MLLRTSHVLLEILAVILASLVLVLVGGAWRLSQGPVSLGFLKPYVDTELAAIKGPVGIEIEDLILKWVGWQRALDIVAVNASVKSRDGALLASAPEISVSLSGKALLAGVIAPTSLELIRPRITVVRNKNQGFGVGVTPADGDAEIDRFLPLVMDTLAARPDSEGLLSKLRTISVIGAKITVDDPWIGASWGARYADITVSRRPGGIHATFDMDVEIKGQTPSLRGTIDFRPTAGKIAVTTRFEKLRTDLLGAEIEALAPLKALGVTLAGSASFGGTLDGALTDASFDVSGGEGTLSLPYPRLRKLAIKSIAANGRFDAKRNRLVVKRLAVDLGGPKIEINGTATRKTGHAEFKVKAVISALPVNDLGRYWPPDVATGGFEWVTTNARGGVFEKTDIALSGSVRTRGGSVTIDSFGATAKVRGTAIHFLRPMPPVRDTDLTISFGLDRIDIQVEGGNLDGITVSEGSVELTRLAEEEPVLETNLVLRGGLSDALTLLDHPRLGYPSKLGIDPAMMKGETAIRVSTQFPLIKDLRLSQINIRAAANLIDVSAPAVAFGRDLTEGQIALRLDQKAMSLIGQARIDGVAGDIAWYQNFDDDAPFTQRYDLKATFDDAARQRFGVDPGKTLDGPITAELSYVKWTKGDPTLYAKLKLDDATVAIPFLRWSKPPGKPGMAELEVGFRKGRMAEIKGYQFTTDDLRSTGSLTFAGDGETITSLKLNSLTLREKTDISGTARRAPDGRYVISLAGPQLDIAPFFEDDSDGDKDDGPSIGFRAQAKIGKLWIGPESSFANVETVLERDENSWRRVSLDGDVVKGRRISANYVNDGKIERLKLNAADAGEVLNKLGLSSILRGGDLSLSTTRQGPGSGKPWRGKLKISDFVITKAPFMAKLLTLASLTGISNLMSGKGIVFNRLDMPFSYASELLKITGARAVGSELGLTGDGSINLGSSEIDLEGSVIPAYTINSILGNIPILGPVFTGTKGGGVFAVTYIMKGTFEKTRIEVNPLSALAPGFLRNLIKGLGKAGKPAPPPGSEQDPDPDG